jgi:hypothetical protein
MRPLAVPETRNRRLGKVGPRQEQNHRSASGNVRAPLDVARPPALRGGALALGDGSEVADGDGPAVGGRVGGRRVGEPVAVAERAEVVVEGVVLHHEDHHVADLRHSVRAGRDRGVGEAGQIPGGVPVPEPAPPGELLEALVHPGSLPHVAATPRSRQRVDAGSVWAPARVWAPAACGRRQRVGAGAPDLGGAGPRRPARHPTASAPAVSVARRPWVPAPDGSDGGVRSGSAGRRETRRIALVRYIDTSASSSRSRSGWA